MKTTIPAILLTLAMVATTFAAVRTSESMKREAQRLVNEQLVAKLNFVFLGETSRFSRIGPSQFFRAEFADAKGHYIPFTVIKYDRNAGRLKAKQLAEAKKAEDVKQGEPRPMTEADQVKPKLAEQAPAHVNLRLPFEHVFATGHYDTTSRTISVNYDGGMVPVQVYLARVQPKAKKGDLAQQLKILNVKQ